jgi:hypothetical protein
VFALSVFPLQAAEVAGEETDDVDEQQSVQGATDNQAGNSTKEAMPVYIPPQRGAPLVRVDAGVRGAGGEQPYVAVISPEHTGYTSTPQPSLYWYVSGDMRTRFEFALVNNQAIEPIVEVVTEEAIAKGIHSINLADHGITLAPGISYQWSVALVPDAGKRSSDIVSSGRVEYVPLTAAQGAAIDHADADEAVSIYARNGYWYDAFSQLSGLLANNPQDTRLRGQRTALLQQIGMDEGLR